jgi:hypothetical protein
MSDEKLMFQCVDCGKETTWTDAHLRDHGGRDCVDCSGELAEKSVFDIQLCDVNNPDDMDELTPEQIAEVQRRIKKIDDPTRYVITSEILDRRFYFNISTNFWGEKPQEATLFKEAKYAEAMMTCLGEYTDHYEIVKMKDENDYTLNTMSINDLSELIDASFKLDCIEGAGVDNWDGYEFAMQAYNGEEDDG